jgi:hypothetical protein
MRDLPSPLLRFYWLGGSSDSMLVLNNGHLQIAHQEKGAAYYSRDNQARIFRSAEIHGHV